jgi:hypothetical protein
MAFFIRCPTRVTANGYGKYRPLDRNRDRSDFRVDHELTKKDSLFSRFSWQNRDPDAFTFEQTGSRRHRAVNPAFSIAARRPSRGPTADACVVQHHGERAARGPVHDGQSQEPLRCRAGRARAGTDVPALAQTTRFPTFLFPAQTGFRCPRPTPEHFRDGPVAISISNNLTWLKGHC